MEQTPTIYTLDQFNREVDQGHILEVSVSGPSQSVRIICVTPINNHGGICYTHLRDLWIVEIKGIKLMAVGCGVCCFQGHRKIGQERYINGKDG